jgi:dTDP-4-amino-4,6-dideoxygalactose transaminase
MTIPFLDLKAQNSALRQEILPLWAEILDSAAFVGGKYVKDFEQEFAALTHSTHCVALNSGTDALRFIFLALGLHSGGEVITVPNTFIATTEAISQSGGKPVFVDIDPGTYTLDPSKIEAAITPKTKGIVPVHLYGQPAEMDAIIAIAKKHQLWVVEDACQAHLAEYNGRTVGTLGRAAAFSFYPGKNLGACGDAGAVTTNDFELATTITMLRDHGQIRKYFHAMEGYNGRCDALQAAALSVKLKYLPQWTEARRRHARRYRELLRDIPGLILPQAIPGNQSVYHLFVIQVENRDHLMQELQKKGVSTGLHYPLPLHRQEAYAHLHLPAGSFPIAEACAERLLSLPLYPELNDAQIVFVCESIKDILK